MKRSFNPDNLLFVIPIIFFIQILSIFISSTADAHKVSAYAYREGYKILGECYFVDGSACKNSKVEVYNTKGDKILETLTDEKGKFSFTTKEKGELKIVIPAGEGHRAEYRIEGIKEQVERKEIKKEVLKEEKQSKSNQNYLDREELTKMIDEVMDLKLQGLRSEIMDLRKQMDRIGLRDIFGGIGYIFGIWGIIMLIKRKRNAS